MYQNTVDKLMDVFIGDFPEKPKPIETNVLCPKCGRPLKKSQWKYECECGFNVWHTAAKVELSEEILTELFTTGKTKKKVTGFTSKAGNVFDTCLKFENDQISFDFDNPGEEEVQSTAEVHNNADAQNNADAYNNADTQNNAEVQSTADDAPDKTTMNNTTMDEMGIPEEFLATTVRFSVKSTGSGRKVILYCSMSMS